MQGKPPAQLYYLLSHTSTSFLKTILHWVEEMTFYKACFLCLFSWFLSVVLTYKIVSLRCSALYIIINVYYIMITTQSLAPIHNHTIDHTIYFAQPVPLSSENQQSVLRIEGVFFIVDFLCFFTFQEWVKSIWYLSFSVLLISLCIIVFGCIHIVTNSKI